MGRPPEQNQGQDADDAAMERRRRLGKSYQGALEAVMAVAVAGGAGFWADSRFGTAPWLLLLGVVLGFATFVLRLVRLSQQMMVSQDPDGSDGNEDGSP